jgi:uncharacterized protein (DUF952 family)
VLLDEEALGPVYNLTGVFFMSSIYHIARASLVEAAEGRGVYAPHEFDRDGFIHCSYARQLKEVASRSWRPDRWLLMEIDGAQVAEQLVEENLEGGNDLFPHLYGKLPMVAVLAVSPLTRDDETGRLILPESLGW